MREDSFEKTLLAELESWALTIDTHVRKFKKTLNFRRTAVVFYCMKITVIRRHLSKSQSRIVTSLRGKILSNIFSKHFFNFFDGNSYF